MMANRALFLVILAFTGCTSVSVSRGDLVVKVVDFHPAGSKTDFRIKKTGDDYAIDTFRSVPSSDEVISAVVTGAVGVVLP